MAYPLIIFGAGASYDYSPLGKPGDIAPLANQLADEKFIHSGFLDKYKGAGSLLVDIVHQVRDRKRNFEEVLTEIQINSAKSIQMKKHFIDLEYYLKDLFTYISKPHDLNRKMHQVSNYHAIVNRINTYTEGKALIATFNYDSLFENSLNTQKPFKMDDYVFNDIKIIKLHGSHDWVYIDRISGSRRIIPEGIKNGYELCILNPSVLDEIKDQGYDPLHEQELVEYSGRNEFNTFPALAVPLTGKDKYVCPDKHTDLFKKELPLIDRILIIGWKAEDPLLLETLRNCMNQAGVCKILIVSGTLDEAKNIAQKVKSSLVLVDETYIEVWGGGFSGFISDPISHEFFS